MCGCLCDRAHAQPKTFFAAERTFLSWINLSVMLMFVALSLLATAASFARNAIRATGPPVLPGNWPTAATTTAPFQMQLGPANETATSTTSATTAPTTNAANQLPNVWGTGGNIPGTGSGVGGGVTSMLGGVMVPAATAAAASVGGGTGVMGAQPAFTGGLYALCGTAGGACRAGLVSDSVFVVC